MFRSIAVLSSLLLALSIFTTTAFAGDCTLKITRTACSGMEGESYKKCGGKQACDELKETASADACANEGLKACENTRLDITKSKVITADFDGEAVQGGKNLCDPARPDFNKCN